MWREFRAKRTKEESEVGKEYKSKETIFIGSNIN